MHKIFACLLTKFYLFLSFFTILSHSLSIFTMDFAILHWSYRETSRRTDSAWNEPLGGKKIAVRPFGVWETERQRWKATEWNWTNCIAFFLMTVTWYASIDVRLHWLWLRDNSIKTNHLPVPYILCFLIFQLNEQRLNKQDYTAKIGSFFSHIYLSDSCQQYLNKPLHQLNLLGNFFPSSLFLSLQNISKIFCLSINPFHHDADIVTASGQ